MNSLIPLRPRLQRLDDMFPQALRSFMNPVSLDMDFSSEIQIDVTEDDTGYKVSAAIPGVKKEDIKVTVDGSYVLISAEAREEKEIKSGNGSRTLIKELYRGSCSRGFTLGHDVDEKAATVKYEDGVLNMTLPKRKEAATKVLKIQ